MSNFFNSPDIYIKIQVMIRYYTTEELQHPEKFFKYDDEELFLSPDELKERKQRRVRTPKERDWEVDAVSNALIDL